MFPENPKISVLMTVYNGERFIKEAIESILGQTFKDFEFVIVNDGSTDSTTKIIRSFSDTRIRLIEHKLNRGISFSTNLGIRECKGQFIALSDSDDITCSERLRKQYDYMLKNPCCDVCGTFIRTIGDCNTLWKMPVSNDEIKVALMWNCPVMNPSAFLRKDTLLKHQIIYDEKYVSAQDYDLWERMAFNCNAHFHNISETLVQYRIHAKSISFVSELSKQLDTINIRKRQLTRILGSESDKFESTFFQIAPWEPTGGIDFVRKVAVLFNRMIDMNMNRKIYNQRILTKYLLNFFSRQCRLHACLGLDVLGVYWDFLCNYKKYLLYPDVLVRMLLTFWKVFSKSKVQRSSRR